MYSFLAKQILQIVWTGFLEKLFLVIVKNLMYMSPMQSVLNKFYMDDFLDFCDNLDETITTVHDVKLFLTFTF